MKVLGSDLLNHRLDHLILIYYFAIWFWVIHKKFKYIVLLLIVESYLKYQYQHESRRLKTVTSKYYVLLIVFIITIVEFEFPGPVVEMVVVVIEWQNIFRWNCIPS